MTQSLLSRKASLLGSPEWCMRRWSQKRKDQSGNDIFQMLCDHGYALAALLEESDNLDLMNEDASAEATQKNLRRCSAMAGSLNLWYQDFVRQSDSPTYWLTPFDGLMAMNSTVKYWDPVLYKYRPFSFPNFETAKTTIIYWGLKIVVSSHITKVCSITLSAPAFQTATPLKTIAQQMLVQHGETVRLENATNIMRSMPYCLKDDMGLMGPQKSLFALRVALLSLEGSQIEESEMCAQMYRILHQKKGLGYAKQLADIDSKWKIDPALDLIGVTE